VLSNQLEEQFRIRETETEALLERMEEQYQAKVRGTNTFLKICFNDLMFDLE